MFSSKRDFLRWSVGGRLTAWYCAFFLLSIFTLFALVYFTLRTNLEKTDREIIHGKLKELAEELKEGGIGELHRAALEKRSAGFFVRLADPQNHSIFLSVPDDLEDLPQWREAIERQQPSPDHWLALRLPNHPPLELANLVTANGSFLEVGRDVQHRQIFLSHFRKVCAAVLFPMILLALGGGAFIAQRALAPIRELNEAVRAIIDTGRIDARISPRKTAGELHDLVVSFNQMLERIDRLIQGMRGVLDNVAHDLRTPLARLRGLAEMALQNPCDVVSSREALADCLEESERVLTMLNTLMDISEAETGAMRLDLKNVCVNAVVEQVVDLYRHVAEEKNIRLSVTSGREGAAQADENRLRQAIGNLVDNAVKYTPDGGAVGIEIAHATGQVIIGVRDSGIGIPREELPHVWERLYRGDKSRSQRGLGLGLSLVQAIAQAHAGRCEVESTPGAGSLFRLHLPTAA